MRKIVTMKNGETTPLSTIGISGKSDILRVWSIYDERQVLAEGVYNTDTGDKVVGLENANLRHLYGAFLEDYVHDWNIKNDQFYIYSRVAKIGEQMTLVIELTK